MPKAKSKNPLAAKFGSAIGAHKETEVVRPSGGELPSGINNGIAVLDSMYLKQYEKGDNEGEYFYYASGTVVKPKEFEGVPIEGLKTTVGPWALCDQPNARKEEHQTVDGRVAWVLNQMKLFDAEAVSNLADDGSDLEDLMAELVEAAPTFRFQTWGGDEYDEVDRSTGKKTGKKRRSQVRSTWLGVVDFDVEADDDVQEEETEDEEVEDEEEETEETEEETEEDMEEEGDDIEALLASANDEDAEDCEEAGNRLIELAIEAGATEKAAKAAETWEEVVAMIQGEGEEEEEEEEVSFSKGDVVNYKPPKAKKPNTYECVTSNQSKRTCKLKNVSTGKTLAQPVSWDKLSIAE